LIEGSTTSRADIIGEQLMDERSILVTGARGFIGAQVVRALEQANIRVVEISRSQRAGVSSLSIDLLSENAAHDIARLVKAEAIDTCIHCAWITDHGVYWESPLNDVWAQRSIEIAKAFALNGGKRFVGLGTCVEYALDLNAELLNELVSPIDPKTRYGRAKDETRRALEAVGLEHGISIAWARLFHLYGPGEDPRRLVPSVLDAVRVGRQAQCSSGTQKRDFMHVADAGRAIAQLALSHVTGPVNVASGEETTVGAVAKQVGIAAGRADLVALGARPERAGDPASILADVTRLRSEVAFRPQFNLARGIASLVS
jgi:nucleoside-diphosphate-sugar epimerase